MLEVGNYNLRLIATETNTGLVNTQYFTVTIKCSKTITLTASMPTSTYYIDST